MVCQPAYDDLRDAFDEPGKTDVPLLEVAWLKVIGPVHGVADLT